MWKEATVAAHSWKMQKVTRNDNSWQDLLANWKVQCESYGEPFDEYAASTRPILDELAGDLTTKTAGVYALHDGKNYAAVCQLNVARLPHTEGITLRVRHVLVCPRLDFEDVEAEQLGELMGQLLYNIHRVSLSELKSDHIRIHLRSPLEQSYFSVLAGYLSASGAVKRVESKGAWIYLTK
jgi:hypothetical protein